VDDCPVNSTFKQPLVVSAEIVTTQELAPLSWDIKVVVTKPTKKVAAALAPLFINPLNSQQEELPPFVIAATISNLYRFSW